MNFLIKKVLKFLLTTVLLSAIQNLLKSEINKRVVPKAENLIKRLLSKIFKKKQTIEHEIQPLTEFEKAELKKKKDEAIDME